MIEINISKEGADSPSTTTSKKQGNDTKVITTTTKASSSSSSPWLRLKDPRIVRVSRVFGGKDRHSKVCTIRGLRDRRVRLSVPTAIQLYDLQDRLGLNQPSKVIDWLLNAAKNEIDQLPPLPFPVVTTPPPPPALNPMINKSEDHHHNNPDHHVGLSRSSFWSSDAFWRAKSDEEDVGQEKQQGDSSTSADHHHHGAQVNPLFNNAVVQLPYGSYYHLEPSSFPFSHTEEVVHGFNVVPLPSTGTTSPILVCQPPPPQATVGPTVVQPLFPPHYHVENIIDPRKHFQMVSSSSAPQNLLPNSSLNPPYSITQAIRPFDLSMMNSRLNPHSHNNSTTTGNQSDKDKRIQM